VTCEQDDVLILWDGERSGLVTTGLHGAVSSTVARLHSKGEVNPHFLYYFIDSKFKWIQERRTGLAVPHVPKDLKYLLIIDLPTPTEQKKIAAILSSVDDAIQATQAVIDQTRRVKQGLLQQLLTHGIGHTRFRQTEIGEIPEEWEVKPIGQIAKLQAGFAFKGTWATNQGVRWLKIANVSQGNAVWKDESFLPEDFLDEYDDFALQGGDIVVAMTRPVLNGALKVAVLKGEDVPALLNQRVGRLIPRIQEVEKKFLYILMRSSKVSNDIETIISGTDPPNISGKQIENIVVPVPALDEQRHLADIFTSIERKIAQEESCLKELKHVKQGLMQDLLTGRMRVKLDGGGTK